MALRYQRQDLLIGSTADNDAYRGYPGQLTIDETLGTIRLHDGNTLGGTVVSGSFDGILEAESGDVPISDGEGGVEWGPMPGLVTDHGELDGLTDDDHTIYVKADGTRAFTGDVVLGTDGAAERKITLHSDSAGRYCEISSVGTRTLVQAVGASSALRIQSASSTVEIYSNNAAALTFDTSQVGTFAKGFTIGTDGGGDNTITIYSGTAGVYGTLATSATSVTLSSVGAGNDIVLSSADDISLLPAGGDVHIGADAGGTRTLTMHTGTTGVNMVVTAASTGIQFNCVGTTPSIAFNGTERIRFAANGIQIIGNIGGGAPCLRLEQNATGGHAPIGITAASTTDNTGSIVSPGTLVNEGAITGYMKVLVTDSNSGAITGTHYLTLRATPTT